MHNNPDVWKQLNTFKPDVVITGGFNPTMLYAFAYCTLKRKKHIALSDAWEVQEKELNLSSLHRLMRKIIYRRSKACIACSEKGKLYFQNYKVRPGSIFISHLTIYNERFNEAGKVSDRKFHLLFSGRIVDAKNPLFFVEVAKTLKQTINDLKVLMIGNGPLREKMMDELTCAGIEVEYPGHISQERLPLYYASSKLFLFPTAYDAWGITANESLAAGTPVLSHQTPAVQMSL